MKPEIQTLKAEISADLQAIAEIYREIDRLPADADAEYRPIVEAYFLHNLYTAFETIFQRVARVFGNGISDQSGWHADLLRRMSLDIEGIRPHVISRESYLALDELRRFRRLFRSGYRLHFEPSGWLRCGERLNACARSTRRTSAHSCAFWTPCLRHSRTRTPPGPSGGMQFFTS